MVVIAPADQAKPYPKQLDRKLRELRFHLDRRAVRITYWIATDRLPSRA